MKSGHYIAAIIWFAVVLSAHGLSDELPVTRNNQDNYKYSFSVFATNIQGGVAFRVVITNKTDNIPSDSSADLDIVTHTSSSGGAVTGSIGPIQPAIPVRLKKSRRVWVADFSISHELLKKPGLYFVFTEFAHGIENRKAITMPSADFYEIKLQDFVKPAATDQKSYSPPAPDQLRRRKYRFDSKKFWPNFERLTYVEATIHAKMHAGGLSFGSFDPLEIVQAAFIKLLKDEEGMSFQPPAAVFLNDRLDEVLVHGTPTQCRAVDRLITKLQGHPVEIIQE